MPIKFEKKNIPLAISLYGLNSICVGVVIWTPRLDFVLESGWSGQPLHCDHVLGVFLLSLWISSVNLGCNRSLLVLLLYQMRKEHRLCML